MPVTARALVNTESTPFSARPESPNFGLKPLLQRPAQRHREPIGDDPHVTGSVGTGNVVELPLRLSDQRGQRSGIAPYAEATTKGAHRPTGLTAQRVYTRSIDLESPALSGQN